MSRIVSSARILLAAMREIFDESAYQRYLARMQAKSSPETYASFCRELDDLKARRPKCC
jgi:hypothetical protein